jgi:hypothetical protein
MTILQVGLGYSGKVRAHGRVIDRDAMGLDEGVPEQGEQDELQDQCNRQVASRPSVRTHAIPFSFVARMCGMHGVLFTRELSVDAGWPMWIDRCRLIDIAPIASCADCLAQAPAAGSDKTTRDNLSLVAGSCGRYISPVFFRQKTHSPLQAPVFGAFFRRRAIRCAR